MSSDIDFQAEEPIDFQRDAPGAGETFVNKAANALPFGKEAVDAATAGILNLYRKHLKSGGVQLSPQARAELEAMGELPKDEFPGFGDEYRSARDQRAESTKTGSEAHPLAAGAGSAAGTVLGILAPLPGVKIGKGLGGAVASGAVNGGLYGGLGGLTGSDALAKGDYKGALKDAGMNALVGTLLGGSLGAAGHGFSEHAPGMLGKLGVSAGRKTLTSGADSLSKRAPVSEGAVRAAYEAGAFKPLGTTEGAFHRLESATGAASDKYTELVRELAKMGVTGPHAQDTAMKIVARGAQVEPHTMSDAVPNLYQEEALRLAGKADKSGLLDLEQSENLRRSLQGKAKYGRISQEHGEVNDARRDIASIVRQANEDQVARAGANTPGTPRVKELADQFVPVKRKLGPLIEATDAAERGAARSAQRSHFGLPEMAAMGGELASGGGVPAAAAGAVGMRVLKGRIPSTLAVAGMGGEQALRSALGKYGASRVSSPGATLAGMEPLIRWLRKRGGVQGGQPEASEAEPLISGR